MDKASFEKAFQKMREKTEKRKFTQSIEMMVNFKGLDTKKAESQIEVRVNLPFATKKGTGKSLLFSLTKEFEEKARSKVNKIIPEEKISTLSKKEIAEILADYDLLLAEGKAVLSVGKHLGQQLAPRGRMPKPIQPTEQSLNEALKELGGSLRITNKKGKKMPFVQVLIRDESMKNEELLQNAFTIYNEVENALPSKAYNIKSIFVKETMGPSIKVGAE